MQSQEMNSATRDELSNFKFCLKLAINAEIRIQNMVDFSKIPTFQRFFIVLDAVSWIST